MQLGNLGEDRCMRCTRMIQFQEKKRNWGADYVDDMECMGSMKHVDDMECLTYGLFHSHFKN